MASLDFVVVGGGPAGLSAALVAQGNAVGVLLLEASPRLGGQLWEADAPIIDVLGQPAEDGPALVARLEAHLRGGGAAVRTSCRVVAIRGLGDRHVLELDDGESLQARAVLLATGHRRRCLEIPGAELVTEGPARKLAPGLAGRDVVVIGAGDEGADTARCLAEAGARVSLVARSGVKARPLFAEPLARTPGVTLWDGLGVQALVGDGRPEAVVLSDGSRLPAEAVFVRVGVEPALPELSPSPVRGEGGILVVDAWGRTSVPGLYAAGDIARPRGQWYVAAALGDGAIVARAVEESLRG